jgi:Glycosyltransferase 61
MHFPNQIEKSRGFTQSFVDALYPELQGRVTFERAPKSYDRVLCAYNLMNSYYHYPDSLVPPVDPLISSRTLWKGKQALRSSQGVLAMNSADRNLYRLRERGLRAIAGKDFSHLPRRFWVGREASHARARSMEGEDELLEMLTMFGFQKVAFETLTPLEQVAIMANAEVMISYHGAGFANMLFANPKAHVLELGTLQTAMFRWGDFWRLANVSGCTYVSFFADFAKENPLIEPNFSEEGIAPVRLSRSGLAVVMSFLVSLLGHVPTFTQARDVQRVAQQLNQIGAADRTWDLFQKHPGVETGNSALCLLLADCHRQRGDSASELLALKSAHAAEPDRAYTVMQIIWCAQKLNDRAEVNWALNRLRNGFPDKYNDLVRDRPWLRRLV